MAKPKVKRQYVFMPIKRLTFWTVLLMGLEMLGLFLWAVGMMLYMLAIGGTILPPLLTFVGVCLFVPLVIISGIVSLIWVYSASRNAHVLRPGGMTSTPGWAVGWFFVPIAGLYKPYETLRDIWAASIGTTEGRHIGPPALIALWWTLFVVGNLILRFSSSDISTGDVIYPSTPSNWAFAFALLVLLAATGCFYVLVRQIARAQANADIRVVDQF